MPPLITTVCAMVLNLDVKTVLPIVRPKISWKINVSIQVFTRTYCSKLGEKLPNRGIV